MLYRLFNGNPPGVAERYGIKARSPRLMLAVSIFPTVRISSSGFWAQKTEEIIRLNRRNEGIFTFSAVAEN